LDWVLRVLEDVDAVYYLFIANMMLVRDVCVNGTLDLCFMGFDPISSNISRSPLPIKHILVLDVRVRVIHGSEGLTS